MGWRNSHFLREKWSDKSRQVNKASLFISANLLVMTRIDESYCPYHAKVRRNAKGCFARPRRGSSLEFLVGAKGISRQIRELKRLAVSNVWLHGDRLQQLQCPMLCRIRHRRHLEGGATVLADACFAGIAHDGGEFIEQRAKAVHG